MHIVHSFPRNHIAVPARLSKGPWNGAPQLLCELNRLLSMANIIRSAKSGGDWTDNELQAFNISIINVDTTAFFGQAVLPPTTVSPVILNNIDMPADANKAEKKFFKLLEDTLYTEESHVDDFAACLLELLDYDTGLRVIHSRKELGFNMCGEHVAAKPDVCVMDRTGRGACVLLVQDKVRSVHCCWNRIYSYLSEEYITHGS